MDRDVDGYFSGHVGTEDRRGAKDAAGYDVLETFDKPDMRRQCKSKTKARLNGTKRIFG